MKRNGFTLVELIVVISVIAVITVVGTVSYGVTNRRARDSRRMADVEKIRIALEMNRQIGAIYPIEANNSASALVPNYMSALPTDPKSGNNYSYNQLTSYTYEIGASMEDTGSTNVAAFNCCYCAGQAGCTSCTAANRWCNYKVSNP